MRDRAATRAKPVAVSSPARDVALKVLLDVERRDAYATPALDARLRRGDYSGRDARLATELVYGVLRHRGTLDWIAGRVAARPPEAIEPVPRNLIRMALYQTLFLDSIPGPVAVDQAVQAAKRTGAKRASGFVNAVLRQAVVRDFASWEADFPSVTSDPIAHLSVATSHPRWMVERWIARFGVGETRALCDANNERPPTSVRVNTLRTTPPDLQRELVERGVAVRPSDWLPEALLLGAGRGVTQSDAFKQGLFMIQDEAAALVARAVDPKPGERILDLAAAPGGKSTHLAQLAEDRAEIVSVDLHPGKARRIEENVDRMGISSVRVQVADIRELPARYSEWADRVLLDAPCSGLGLLRKKPDIRWRRSLQDVRALAELQAELLRCAAALVRPGGVLVYSTCTIESEENEEIVSSFLREGAEFRTESVVQALPPRAATRFLRHTGSQPDVGIRLYPHHHETDGFYMCRLRKA